MPLAVGAPSSVLHHLADPIGKRPAGRAERLGQLAEFQMRMRVDEARQNRRVAQIDDFVCCELARMVLSDANDP